MTWPVKKLVRKWITKDHVESKLQKIPSLSIILLKTVLCKVHKNNLVENQNWSITSQIWLIYFKFNYSEFPQYAYHLTDHRGGFRVSPYMAKLLGHTLFHCCWSHLHENAIGIRHVVTFSVFCLNKNFSQDY